MIKGYRINKMNKKGMGIVLALALLLGMASCGKKEPVVVDINELTAECDYVTTQMYERAVNFQEGDLTRIAAAMRKAQNGETVTVGVIGGSITQGSSARKYENCYASLLEKWWKEQFPEATINFVNAGVGGTSSYLGVHRVEEDLLSKNPDFVVVEFSVNDSNDNFYKKSYDNLVYRLLKHENEPAVLLLFTTMEDGTSAQGNDSMIGFTYELPMVSYKNAIMQEITDGKFTWKDISPDNIHPNDRGHAIIGELLDVYLTSIYMRLEDIPAEKAPFDKEILTKEVYGNATILYSNTITPDTWGSFEERNINNRFPNNWYTESGEESIVFTVEAANIGIMYQKFTSGDGGQYEVYIDGKAIRTLNADFSGGWGDYSETVEIYTSDEVKEHIIEIKKKEGSTGGTFAILGLMIS